ncbi:MAG: glycoside hydrolase [Proteobacteria bacterium]|nr:glycoside hydrolase [Pseudomonadota bacterium]
MTMQVRTWGLAVSLAILGLARSALAQEVADEPIVPDFEQAQVQVSAFPAYPSEDAGETLQGDWIWLNVAVGALTGGTSAVAQDRDDPTLIYAGGGGFVAVSRNGTNTWQTTLTFSQSREGAAFWDSAQADTDERDRERVAILRRYLEVELENQFGATQTEQLMNEIDDNELLRARDVRDIDVLSDLELDMDPNLTALTVDTEDAEDTESAWLASLMNYGARYRALVARGAENDMATAMAADSNLVWQIVAMGTATFAATSEALFVTANRGATWQVALSASDEASILSVAASADASRLVVGLTDGLALSDDGGRSWAHLQDIIPGAVYATAIAPDNPRVIYALTTSSLFRSLDGGLTFSDIAPSQTNDTIIDFAVAPSGALIAITPGTVFRSRDGVRYEVVAQAPFVGASLQQVVLVSGSTDIFAVRTDNAVYLYQQGWIDQNQALFTMGLGPLFITQHLPQHAFIAAQTGLWAAISPATKPDIHTQFEALKRAWAREPSDEIVLKQALKANYLDDGADQWWVTRARLSMILPTVEFQYSFRQERLNSLTAITEQLPVRELFTQRRLTENEWRIMALWRLDLGRKNADEIRITALIASQATLRQNLILEVQRALQVRRSLQMNAASRIHAAETAEEVQQLLSIDEVEAQLHYLTGGFYKTAISQNP